MIQNFGNLENILKILNIKLKHLIQQQCSSKAKDFENSKNILSFLKSHYDEDSCSTHPTGR